MEHKKHFWVWAVVVIVLIVLAICLAVWRIGSVQKTATETTVVSNVSSDQIPVGFPPNIPIEQQALVMSNFNATTQNGQLQSTRSFKSFKAASDNIALYTDFLAKSANGWGLVASSTDSSGDKTMVARNSGGLLTIRVSPIPPQPMPASLVEITYVSNPPAILPPAVAPSGTHP